MFLIFYVAGLGALCVVMWCERRGVRPAMLPDPLPELSTHELAYLHGGEHQVADTELAVLHRQRKLVVTRDLLLAAVGRIDGAWWGPDATLSNVLLAACRKRPQRPGDLMSVAKEGREMATLPIRLRQLGLISSARIRALRRWGPLVLLAAWLLVGLLVLVSTARSQASLVATVDYRVADSWLAVVMVLGGIFAGAACVVNAMEPGACNTRAGTAIVKALRHACRDRGIRVSGPLCGRPSDQQPVRAAGTPRDDKVWERYGPLLSSPEGTVAVFGLSSYPDANLTGPRSDFRGGGGV